LDRGDLNRLEPGPAHERRQLSHGVPAIAHNKLGGELLSSAFERSFR
jgi:hypothetical protein